MGREQQTTQLIFILGMHRSGTSAITKGLEVLGVDLGQNLMPPLDSNNEKGFFEDLDVNALNIELMRALGHDWNTSAPLRPEELTESPVSREFLLRAVDLLRDKLQNSKCFGLKDPRIARLLPFWRIVLEHVKCRVRYIIAYRNPVSVARSLSKRDGMAAEKAYYLWFEHMLHSLMFTRGARRLVVDYDRVMEDPESQLKRIADNMGLPFDPNNQSFIDYRESFLEKRLQHHRFEVSDLLLDGAANSIIFKLSSLLSDLAGDTRSVDSEEVESCLTYANSQLKEDLPKLNYIKNVENSLIITQKKVSGRGERIADLNRQLDARNEQVASLSGDVAERDGRIAGLTGQVASLYEAVNDRDARIASLTDTVAEQNAKTIELSSTLNQSEHRALQLQYQHDEIIPSMSWRLTGPVRQAIELASRLGTFFLKIISTTNNNNQDDADMTVLSDRRNSSNDDHLGQQEHRGEKPNRILSLLNEAKYYDHSLAQISTHELSSIPMVKPQENLPIYYPCYAEMINSIPGKCDCIIFVPWLSYGGSDLEAIYALKAAQEYYGIDNVMMVVTDSKNTSSLEWLPGGSHVRVLAKDDAILSSEDRQHLVKSLIHHLQPSSVVNVNSRACWNVYKHYGRALSHSSQLYAMLFCYDYLHDNTIHGYIVEYLRDCLPYLAGLFSDNKAIWKEMVNHYGLPKVVLSKCKTVYQPVEPTPSSVVFGGKASDYVANDPPRVLWAGRICRQKNPDLLLRIAGLCPDIQFDVYGEPDDQYREWIKAHGMNNVSYAGAYKKFDDIHAAKYKAYLYTSLWDGLPNVLIKVGSMSVPIVASRLEGIAELIDQSTGWPVCDITEPGGYIEALRMILANPSEAAARAQALKARIDERHSWSSYIKCLEQSPGFLVGKSGTK